MAHCCCVCNKECIDTPGPELTSEMICADCFKLAFVDRMAVFKAAMRSCVGRRPKENDALNRYITSKLRYLNQQWLGSRMNYMKQYIHVKQMMLNSPSSQLGSHYYCFNPAQFIPKNQKSYRAALEAVLCIPGVTKIVRAYANICKCHCQLRSDQSRRQPLR